MMPTVEEFDPEKVRYILLGGEGLWLIDLSTGKVVDKLEGEREHWYHVLAPGLVDWEKVGIVVPKVKVPSEVQVGAREIELRCPEYARVTGWVYIQGRDELIHGNIQDGKIVLERPLEKEGEYEVEIDYRCSLPIPGAPCVWEDLKTTLRVVKGSKGLPAIPVIPVALRRRTHAG
jgi:hypothetical protein